MFRWAVLPASFLVNFHRQAFKVSEWGPGLCSIAGDPPFNKIFLRLPVPISYMTL
jgi:hypothetical protein